MKTGYPARYLMKNFNGLKHGDKIISPIDREVTEFYIDSEGKQYLASRHSLFTIGQFDPADFEIYTGNLEVGEVESENYFRK